MPMAGWVNVPEASSVIDAPGFIVTSTLPALPPLPPNGVSLALLPAPAPPSDSAQIPAELGPVVPVSPAVP